MTRTVALASAFTFALFPAGASITLGINPRATYLRTNNDSGSINSSAINILGLGLRAGDLAKFERRGGFRARVGGPENENSDMIAVFSSSNTLRTADNRFRVAGAIEAGPPEVVTPATFSGGLATDIEEDFLIARTSGRNSTLITVPVGTAFVFIAALDNAYGDNLDGDGDFTVTVTRICPADFNADGFTDFFDYADFVTCFEGGTCPEGRTSDVNGDGFADFFDYADYVALFEAGGC
jgi:hypothetical protein